MRTRHVSAVCLSLCALLLVSCARQNPANITLVEQIKKQDASSLKVEKPVRAVCAAVKLMAANPSTYGLADLRTDSPLLNMGITGAARWSLLNTDISKNAGNDWMKTSAASEMFMRDYIVFSAAVSENLNPETAISTPEMTTTKAALRSVQSGCRALFGDDAYRIIP